MSTWWDLAAPYVVRSSWLGPFKDLILSVNHVTCILTHVETARALHEVGSKPRGALTRVIMWLDITHFDVPFTNGKVTFLRESVCAHNIPLALRRVFSYSSLISSVQMFNLICLNRGSWKHAVCTSTKIEPKIEINIHIYAYFKFQ